MSYTPTALDPHNGIAAPGDWGSLSWKAWRDGARSSLFTFVCYGDSISAGFFSSSNATKGWFGKLMTDLQALYGDGGSGFISTAETIGVTAGSAGRITATGSGGTVGGWDSATLGINGHALNPHAAGNGATLTFTGVRGTSIDIYWLPLSTATHFTYNIDGAGAVDVSCQGITGNIGKTTIAGLSNTSHTVVITATTLTCFIYGMTGRNAAGVIGHNMSKAGRVASAMANAAAAGLNAAEFEGKQSIQNFMTATNSCFIMALGSNDANNSVFPSSQQDRSVAPATHTHTENTALTYTQNATTGAGTVAAPGTSIANGYETFLAEGALWARVANPSCELIFVMPHPGRNLLEGGSGAFDPKFLLRQYSSPIYNIARTMGAAVHDHGLLGRSSWAYFNSLGYWGDATSDGLAGTDNVHYSDTGHAAVEAPLLALMRR